MRFIHTSDWQIGKNFRFADNDTQSVLQNQRLEAIGRLGRLALEQQVTDIVVAGDVYDHAIPSDRTLREPVERMRQFAGVRWHLIPGNHDPHTPDGLWERISAIGLPDNIVAHLTPQASPLDPSRPDQAWILPAVLTRKHVAQDPTTVMDAMATPEGVVRLGLAHGPVRGFGEQDNARNLIAIDRAQRSGLSYLALGDWHGASEINPRTWYSGTPETDGFDRGGAGGGHALVVTLNGPSAKPEILSAQTGHFHWHRVEATLGEAADIEALEHRLRSVDREDLSRALVWLKVEGILRITDLEHWEERIVRGLGSALRLLRLDGAPLLEADADDLHRIGSGALLNAATILADRSQHDEIARAALQRLFIMTAQKGVTK